MNDSVTVDTPQPNGPSRRRATPRRKAGCLPVAMAGFFILIIVAVAGFYTWDRVGGALGFAPDFPGPGSGEVSFEVHEGDTITAIGRNLQYAGVVKSVDAFKNAARDNPDATKIQVGFYDLKQEMKASDALEVLVNPANLVKNRVLVPEGAKVRDVVASIVAKTDISEAEIERALKHPATLGLPPAAGGNPEGWLFPATYDAPPGTTAKALLSQMISKTISTLDTLDAANRAKSLGLSVDQVLTVASIAQKEANRSEDYPKVTRVIYNRLKAGMPLQMDSTITYLSGRQGDVWTTAEERQSDSAYNTYKHTGLPPGPIGSPGEETIEAALNPAAGDWLYFVNDYETGGMHFTASYEEHLKYVAKAKEFCRKSEKC